MSFRDYSLVPASNTTLEDGTYIGPNMLRNKVRPALQQIAADGKELADEVTSTLELVGVQDEIVILAPVADEIVTVAGSIANVNTTAGAIANVNTVGANIASVNSAATNMAAIIAAPAQATAAANSAALADADRIDAAASAITAAAAVSNALAANSRALAAEMGFSLGPNGAMGWFPHLWATTFFQDTSATTPVTASGQSVRCIKDAFGNTNNDMILPGGTSPIFRIKDGIPYLECAAGTGLYSRANVTMRIPSILIAAMEMTNANVNPAFGYVKNTADRFYLAADANFARGRAYIQGTSPVRAFIIPASELYSGPDYSRSVYHAQASAAYVDCRIGEIPDSPTYSPKVTAWADGDTVSGMTFGINVASQALTLGVPDPSKPLNFFGGVCIFDELSPEARAAVVSYFENKASPAIREADEVDLYVGDSISDDIDTADSVYKAESVLSMVQNGLIAAEPTATIYYRNYCRLGNDFTAWRLIQEGTDDVRRFVSNASVAGAQPSHHLADRWPNLLTEHPHANRIIMDHGHNMPVSVTDASGYLRRGEFIDAIDQYRLAFPNANWMIVRPHPRLADSNMLPVVTAIDAVAAAYGDFTIADVYAPVIAAGKPAGYYVDGVHLTVATGMPVKRDVISPLYVAMAASNSSPPLMGRTTTNGLLNGFFDDFDSAVPDSWTASAGAGTISRSGDVVDTEMGDNYSVKLNGVKYLQQTFVPTAAMLSAGVAVLAVRLALAEGSDTSAGRLQAFTNGTGAVSNTSWIYESSGKPTGRFRWAILHIPIPADATLGTIRLHGVTATTGTSYIGRAILVSGTRPKNVRH